MENPIREAYYQWAEKQHIGRSSWDQVAVLYGVRGLENNFDEMTTGKGRLRNGYEWTMKQGSRSWLKALINDDQTAAIIEPLMIKAPDRMVIDSPAE